MDGLPAVILEGLPASGGLARRYSCPPFLWRAGLLTILWMHHLQEREFKV